MAPFLVFSVDGGALEMVLGSPGGSHIVGYVVKLLVATLDWKMDIQTAIDLPNFVSRNGPTEIEAGTEPERLRPPLNTMAPHVPSVELTNRLPLILPSAGSCTNGPEKRPAR